MGGTESQCSETESTSTQTNNQNIMEVVTEAIKNKITNKGEQEKYQKLFCKCVQNQKTNRALGCLFGGFIGDSLGSYCQFSNSIDRKLIKEVMLMPGGGVFSVRPGQFTDDSQLAASLLQSLLKMNFKKELSTQHYQLLKEISYSYISWLDSKPFDIGITCRKSIMKLKSYQHQLTTSKQSQLPSLFPLIFQDILHQNTKSQSNGSLMRIAPLAILFAFKDISTPKHQQFIKDQVRLMHPNHILQLSSQLWVSTLTKTINRTDNSPKTFQHIFKEVKNMDTNQQLSDWWCQSKQSTAMPGTINIGWAKIAWTYGMNILYRMGKEQSKEVTLDKYFYKKQIRKTITQGGDTDTNAAIVGQLLGSIVGFSNLPPNYIKKMLELTFPQQNEAILDSQRRPHRFEPFEVFKESLDFISQCEKHSDISQTR